MITKTMKKKEKEITLQEIDRRCLKYLSKYFIKKYLENLKSKGLSLRKLRNEGYWNEETYYVLEDEKDNNLYTIFHNSTSMNDEQSVGEYYHLFKINKTTGEINLIKEYLEPKKLEDYILLIEEDRYLFYGSFSI
jgi:hypothetical protein